MYSLGGGGGVRLDKRIHYFHAKLFMVCRFTYKTHVLYDLDYRTAPIELIETDMLSLLRSHHSGHTLTKT